MARPPAHDRIEIARKRADKVHHRIRPVDHRVQRCLIRDVAARELDLAEIGKRAERERLLGIARRDAQPRAPFQQGLRHMGPEKATAADQRNQPALQTRHVVPFTCAADVPPVITKPRLRPSAPHTATAETRLGVSDFPAQVAAHRLHGRANRLWMAVMKAAIR